MTTPATPRRGRGLPSIVTAHTPDGRLVIASLDPRGIDTPLRRQLDVLAASAPVKKTPGSDKA